MSVITELFNTNFLKIKEKYQERNSPEVTEELLAENELQVNSYKIPSELRDHLRSPVYTVDPEGCTDADDGFSIYTQGDTIVLSIHIADPTDYISIRSNLWKDIRKRGVTCYPSNTEPIHLLPSEILRQCTLRPNDGEIRSFRKTISISVEIDRKTFLPKDDTANLFFCKQVEVKKSQTFTYEEASEISMMGSGIKIAEAIERKRGSIGSVLNSESVTTIKYIDGLPILKKDTDKVRRVKNMIAQFAIYANSFIGEYLSKNLDELGIFRTCDASDLEVGASKSDLLNSIVKDGIQADYKHVPESHDLVGIEKYSHFTSPMRRASDMYVHYLLKYIYLKKNDVLEDKIMVPFEKEELRMVSDECHIISKINRKINREDTKFRLIQYMFINKPVEISVRFTNYIKERFFNCMITKINGFDVALSITFKVTRCEVIPWNQYREFNTTITNVFPFKRFDSDIFPSLYEGCVSFFLKSKM